MTNKEKGILQKKIISVVKEKDSGRLILAPRVGKTKMIIDIIKRDKPKSILWVTPTSKLAEEDIPKEFKKWKASSYIKKLKTITWKSLSKIEGEFDLIILDEEQFMTDKNSLTLVNKKLTGRIISMTGTESKHKVKQELYGKLDLKVLYRLGIDEAVEIGLLSDYEIKVIGVSLDEKKNIHVKTKKWDFWTSEKKSYERINKITEENKNKRNILTRMSVIKNSPSKIAAAKYIVNSLEGRRLIFTANTKQAEELCDNVYHSKTDEKALIDFIKHKINKIAMVNKGGTGYTYTKIDHLIITQIDSDDNGLTSQKIARTLLEQKGYKATIWLLYLEGTQDSIWMTKVLAKFNKNKIEYIKFKDLII